MKLINSLSPEQVAQYEASNSLEIDGKIFKEGEILIFREPKEGTGTISNKFISIDIDCELNQSLLDEGLAREIVNRIQKTRKDIDLNVSDRIEINYHGSEKLEQVLSQFKEHIMSETLTLSLNKTDGDLHSPHRHQIENFELVLDIKKSK